MLLWSNLRKGNVFPWIHETMSENGVRWVYEKLNNPFLFSSHITLTASTKERWKPANTIQFSSFLHIIFSHFFFNVRHSLFSTKFRINVCWLVLKLFTWRNKHSELCKTSFIVCNFFPSTTSCNHFLFSKILTRYYFLSLSPLVFKIKQFTDKSFALFLWPEMKRKAETEHVSKLKACCSLPVIQLPPTHFLCIKLSCMIMWIMAHLLLRVPDESLCFRMHIIFRRCHLKHIKRWCMQMRR